MIIYNVTISIDQVVEVQWLNWMQKKHIQEVLDTGCFVSARLSRLTSHNQPDATSYSIQYLCESNELLQQYYKEFAPKLREEGTKLFGNKMQGFRTELDVIEDFYTNRS